jgi:hypothetical protein
LIILAIYHLISNLQEIDRGVEPRAKALSGNDVNKRVSRMIADPAFRLG